MTRQTGKGLLWLAVLALSLLGGGAFAQGQSSFPADLRGVWGAESCTENEASYIVIRGTMALVIENGEAKTQPLSVQGAPDAAGWLKGRFKDKTLFFRRVTGASDTLEVARARADAPPAASPGPTPDPAAWKIERSPGCAALPPAPQAVFGEMLAVLTALDTAEAACADGPEPCMRALFAVGDVNPNGALNTAEISRLIRVLVQLGAIEQGNGSAAAQAGIIAASVPLAPILSRALVSSFDYDGDNGLSLDEILGDRVVLPSSDMSQILTGAESRVSEMMNTLESRASDIGRLLMMMTR